MTDPNDQRVLKHYKAANAALDEAPRDQTRAAILAAAARAAGSRPQPVGRARRWRLPLAAAASLLVGTVAVLLATRIDEVAVEDAEPMRPTASVAVSSAAEPAARGDAADSTAESKVADAAEIGRAVPSEGRLREQRPSAPPAARDSARNDQTAQRNEPAAPAAAVAPPVAAAAKPEAFADRRATAAAPAERSAREEIGGMRRSAEAAAKEAPWRATAEAWIEHIVKLRAEDHHDEADAELKLLRERHPDLRLPAGVLRPSGR